MKSRNIFGAVLLGAILSQGGWAQESQPQDQQESQPQNQNDQNDTAPLDTSQHVAPAPALAGGLLPQWGGSSDWTTRGPAVPAIVGGYGSSLAFSTEMERSNFIRGGVAVQTGYDDNPYLSTSSNANNFVVSVLPQIVLDQTRARVHWLLDYSGGYTFNQQLQVHNTTSQNLGFDLQYRMSPHVNVRVTENLHYTSGLFSPADNYDGTAPGVPQGNNPFIVTPLATEFANLSRGEIDYQFSGSAVMGASGGYSTYRYSNTPPGFNLLNTTSQDAAGFYLHRLTLNNWLGTSYTFQHLMFSPTPGETFIHSLLIFDTITLRQHMALSFFAGPQYFQDTAPVSVHQSRTLSFLLGPQYSEDAAVLSSPSVLAEQTGWTTAAGVSYGWQGPHTSAAVSVVRRLSDGGGLLGAAQVTSAMGGFRRQLTRNWWGELGANYALSEALSSTLTNTSSIRSASGGFGVERRFGERVSVRFAYLHQFQNIAAVTSTNNGANRDELIVTLSYLFTRPWGR
jgi:hypothetical protein